MVAHPLEGSPEAFVVARMQGPDHIFVVAAGNDGLNTDLPGNQAHPAGLKPSPDIVLAVASTTASESLSSFSNYGASSVDIAAPGSSILSTIPTSQGSYAYLSGTSMATPLVAGIAAVIRKMDRSLSGTAIKDILMKNSDVLSAYQGKVMSGEHKQPPSHFERVSSNDTLMILFLLAMHILNRHTIWLIMSRREGEHAQGFAGS